MINMRRGEIQAQFIRTSGSIESELIGYECGKRLVGFGARESNLRLGVL